MFRLFGSWQFFSGNFTDYTLCTTPQPFVKVNSLYVLDFVIESGTSRENCYLALDGPFLPGWLVQYFLSIKRPTPRLDFQSTACYTGIVTFEKTWSTKFLKVLISKSKVLNPVSYCIRRRKLCKEWISLRAVHGLETLFVLRKKYPYFRLKSKECIWKFIHTNQSYRQTPMMIQLAPTSNHFFSSSKSPLYRQSKLNQSLPFCVFPNQANYYHRCQRNLSRYHYQMYLRRIGNSSLGPLWTK